MARKSSSDEIKVSNAVSVDRSCVVIVGFSFRIVHCSVGGFRVLVDLAVADTFKSFGSFKSGTESTDSGEHIEKSDCCDHLLFSFCLQLSQRQSQWVDTSVSRLSPPRINNTAAVTLTAAVLPMLRGLPILHRKGVRNCQFPH